MEPNPELIEILIADDDPDDRFMTQQALHEYRVKNGVTFVEDGEELLDYLYCRGKYAERPPQTLPGLILLDLNMPRKDGREALAEIKSHPQFRCIPVVVLTTSKAEEDILRTYDLGVNSYVTKPVTFQALAELMKTLCVYWFEIVKLPHAQRHS